MSGEIYCELELAEGDWRQNSGQMFMEITHFLQQASAAPVNYNVACGCCPLGHDSLSITLNIRSLPLESLSQRNARPRIWA